MIEVVLIQFLKTVNSRDAVTKATGSIYAVSREVEWKRPVIRIKSYLIFKHIHTLRWNKIK